VVTDWTGEATGLGVGGAVVLNVWPRFSELGLEAMAIKTPITSAASGIAMSFTQRVVAADNTITAGEY
jgi:hypothetical protein